MIIAGLGIGLLPVASVMRDVESGQLWPLQIEGASLGADVFLVHSGHGPLTPPEQKFVDLLEELLTLYPHTG